MGWFVPNSTSFHGSCELFFGETANPRVIPFWGDRKSPGDTLFLAIGFGDRKSPGDTLLLAIGFGDEDRICYEPTEDDLSKISPMGPDGTHQDLE